MIGYWQNLKLVSVPEISPDGKMGKQDFSTNSCPRRSQKFTLCLTLRQSKNPLPVADARDCREKRVRNKALQMPCPFTCRAKGIGFLGEPSPVASVVYSRQMWMGGSGAFGLLSRLGRYAAVSPVETAHPRRWCEPTFAANMRRVFLNRSEPHLQTVPSSQRPQCPAKTTCGSRTPVSVEMLDMRSFRMHPWPTRFDFS